MEMYKFPDVVHACIMVVDDHPTTASTLTRAIALLGRGIETLAANSGEQALEMALNQPIDILITDMMMPGINGLELIDMLRSRTKGYPTHIILITAYDIAGRKITAQRLDVNEVIIKPVRPERICQLVYDAILRLHDDVPENLLVSKPVQNPEGLAFPVHPSITNSISNHEEI